MCLHVLCRNRSDLKLEVFVGQWTPAEFWLQIPSLFNSQLLHLTHERNDSYSSVALWVALQSLHNSKDAHTVNPRVSPLGA